MASPTIMRLLPRTAASAAAAVLVAAAAAAQERPSQEGVESRALIRAEVSPTEMLFVSETTIPPGYSAPSHRHPGALFAIVVDGEIRSGIDDGPVVVYGAGDSWFEAVGVEHSHFENASDDATATFVVVRVGSPDSAPPARE